MPIRAYFRPSSLEEASSLLQSYAGSARILAGGTDLLVQSRSERGTEVVLVSLRDIQELRQVREVDEDRCFIGAMVVHAEVARSSLVRQYFPALARASNWVGSPSIRNMATIGGNICNASPSADTAPPLLAYEGKAVIAGPSGEKVVDLESFFTGPSTHILKPGEILKGFILNKERDLKASYEKLGIRKAMEIAIVNVCAVLSSNEQKQCDDIRIALGAVAPTPIRARKAEALLRKRSLTPRLIEECAEAAANETKPISDIRASAEYRKEMVRMLVKKMIRGLAGIH